MIRRTFLSKMEDIPVEKRVSKEEKRRKGQERTGRGGSKGTIGERACSHASTRRDRESEESKSDWLTRPVKRHLL